MAREAGQLVNIHTERSAEILVKGLTKLFNEILKSNKFHKAMESEIILLHKRELNKIEELQTSASRT